MGFYINPPAESKEAWLLQHGEMVPTPTRYIDDSGNVAVVLVDNGQFTAAGIAFSQDELNAFAAPDGRQRVWFMVPINELTADVCGIDMKEIIKRHKDVPTQSNTHSEEM